MKNESSLKSFDYIIAGAGCAGLSLLYRLINTPELSSKKILVIDKDEKSQNDRTWCYWEKNAGVFEPIVHKSWNTLEFKTEDYRNRFDLQSYTYKMIKGIDFYEYVLAAARVISNVTFCKEQITDFSTQDDRGVVITEKNAYSAQYVFNSTPFFNPKMTQKDTLLQHFMGWVINTENDVFDDNIGTLMDFSLEQKPGTAFMYVLPISGREALVEYTLFTPQTIERQEYISKLEQYIENDLGIEAYSVSHKEYGVIPMSKKIFPSSFGGKIINIGTAGGHTKASSGYTFQFVQKEVQEIIQRLQSNKSLVSNSFRQEMFSWYDRTLLEVMLSGKRDGKAIFKRLFQKIDPEIVLSFLANESKFSDELRIMLSLTSWPFITSGIKQLFAKN